MYDFEYITVASAQEASEKLSQNEDAKIIAGGMTLIPTMKQRLAAPEQLIDLKDANLTGIELTGDYLTIGAMTKHADVASHIAVKDFCPALANLAANIGDPQVRNRGTIGGSLANNDPAADYPAACLGLGAVIVTTKREIKADDYFTGLFETALEDDEIITQIKFPKAIEAHYQKFDNPASRYAITGVFVAKFNNTVRVAVTGAGNDGVFRAHGIEKALEGNFNSTSIDISAMPEDCLISDIHASAAYRKNLIAVMAKRAVSAFSS